MLSLLSAIIFSLTLLVPELSIIGMFTFLIPIFSNLQQKKIDGLWFGVITFTTYWWWLIVLFYTTSVSYFGWALFFLIITWGGSISFIWFRFLPRYPLASSLIFFLFVIKYSMIIIADLEGMPFYNPLVLLSCYPLIIKPIYYLTEIGMLLIVFKIQFLIAKNIENKKILYGYLICILVIQTLAICVYQQPEKKEIKNTAIIIPWWHKKGSAMFCGYRLSHDICKTTEHKSTKIILTPESTFCYDLESYEEFIHIWCESANTTPMLLCCHRLKNNYAHNCCLVLHNNEIITSYFKKHQMPLVEKNIWLERFFNKPILSYELIDTVQEKKKESRILFDHDNDLLKINGQIYQIYICSEFFLEVKKIEDYPILLLWNDTWLSCRYAKKLALLFIRYFQEKYMIDVYHIATSGSTNIKT